MVVTWWLHGGYIVVTWWLHGGYMVVTWWLHGGYMVEPLEYLGRYRGGTGEVEGREVQWRWRGGTREVQGRCRGAHPLELVSCAVLLPDGSRKPQHHPNLRIAPRRLDHLGRSRGDAVCVCVGGE